MTEQDNKNYRAAEARRPKPELKYQLRREFMYSVGGPINSQDLSELSHFFLVQVRFLPVPKKRETPRVGAKIMMEVTKRCLDLYGQEKNNNSLISTCIFLYSKKRHLLPDFFIFFFKLVRFPMRTWNMSPYSGSWKYQEVNLTPSGENKYINK